MTTLTTSSSWTWSLLSSLATLVPKSEVSRAQPARPALGRPFPTGRPEPGGRPALGDQNLGGRGAEQDCLIDLVSAPQKGEEWDQIAADFDKVILPG